MDPSLLSCAQTEYVYVTMQEVMRLLGQKDGNVQITLQELKELMVEADVIFEE